MPGGRAGARAALTGAVVVVASLSAAGCRDGGAMAGHVRAYVSRDAGAAAVMRAQRRLDAIPHVDQVTYRSPAGLARQEIKAHPGDAPYLRANPLPGRFDITVDDRADVPPVLRAVRRIRLIAHCNSVPCITYGDFPAGTP
jgi:cell division protein FtsX